MPQAEIVTEATATRHHDQTCEQRTGQRHQLGCSATLTVIGDPSQILSVEVRNVSLGGTQIRLSQCLQPSTLVRIEYSDTLLLGEVVYCREDPFGWLAGIRVEHGLFGLHALARIMRDF